MHQRRPPPTSRRESVCRHANNGVEIRPVEAAIRPRPSDEVVQLLLATLAARRLGDDLLRQHVDRRIVLDDGVEVATTDRPQQRRALDEVVPRDRKETSLGKTGNRVAGTADPLQQGGNPVRRSDLTDEIDMPDIDAQLQRCRGHERLQLSRLQSRFSVQTSFFRQAAVMCRDSVLTQPFAQVPGQAFRHPARVDEHERGFVLADQGCQPVVVLLPYLVRHHRVERGARDLDVEIDPPAVPFVDDRARLGYAPDEEFRDLFNGFLCSREPEPEDWLVGDLTQPLERQREMRTAPRTDDGVNFVHDHRPHGPAACACCARPSGASYSDSGVVTRMCGGVRTIAARSLCVVSPVLTAAVIRGAARPAISARWRIPRRGSERFLWMSVLSALSGET